MKRFSLPALLLLALAAPHAAAEPSTGLRWTLDLQHGRLRIVSVRQADGSSRTYHYITLKVTNPTALPRDWYPVVKAHTDTDKTFVAAGWADGLDAVRAQERNAALVPIESTTGKIAPGATYDTVAIFGPVDPLYDRIKVHVYGLADPIAIYKVLKYPNGTVIQDLAYGDHNKKTLDELAAGNPGGELPEPEVEYQEVSERRVYELKYERLGDEFRPDDDVINPKGERWTIVGEPKVLRVIDM